MNIEDDAVAAHAYLYLYRILKNKNKKKRRIRRWYARPVNSDIVAVGYYQTLFKKLREMDEEHFVKHTRMSTTLYAMLLGMVEKRLTKPKQRIMADERLSITLLFLSQSVSMQSIAWSYKLGKSTVRLIILETCDALWETLAPLYLSEPTESQYADIATDFNRMWNFPNCVGAVDGKHVALKCPKKSGTMYYNYKKFFSIVLMGVCDASYVFTAVSVGSYGSESDGGVFRVCPFGQAIMNEELPLPPDAPFPNSSSKEPLPHVLVADAAFPLCRRIMKPIAPQRNGGLLGLKQTIFNYRLSRARRTIENAFGILTARWRILRTTLEFMPSNSEKIVLACVALHNFVMLNDFARYCPRNYADSYSPDETLVRGEWRNELQECGGPLRSVTSHARRSGASALTLREKFMEYFSKEGAVAFQPK